MELAARPLVAAPEGGCGGAARQIGGGDRERAGQNFVLNGAGGTDTDGRKPTRQYHVVEGRSVVCWGFRLHPRLAPSPSVDGVTVSAA